ncbi:MAG: Transketolase domain protein [Chloroflexi bacterium]|nr:Transketolase domain protein [Chloroflexota bacterium]
MLATDMMGGSPTDERTERLVALNNIADRVLWLSTRIVHHANRIRPNTDGSKVGGHQASSASVVHILTSLYFDFLRAGDRVAVKPHASPVFHAIQYLLGNLDQQYLTTLRAYHGLQAYPSRTKDPDPVDFSTGSVGLGAVAPTFAALVDRYVDTHFTPRTGPQPRFVSIVGDAELDEGSIWEAIAEPELAGLSNVLWIIDLNRQSLDRVVPEIRTPKLEAMFRANGWTVIEAKYGHLLEAAFEGKNGALLRTAIDEMPNPAYQRMLRVPAEEVRERLLAASPRKKQLRDVLARWSDEELAVLVRNLGGHDLVTLRAAYEEAAQASGPAVVFAYTIKGWGLPMAGDPLNHSAMLTDEQIELLRVQCNISADEPFPTFPRDSVEAQICEDIARTLQTARRPHGRRPSEATSVPSDLGVGYRGEQSTQAVLGQILATLARENPDVGRRLVTTSPDVATSTNLGGWINRVGVWGRGVEPDYFGDAGPRPVQWVESKQGQHIELGISENNLCLMLGQLGMSAELHGELLLPIGTLYDPFIARGLDALIYSLYSGSRFIIVGTPSGVTLSPEGGAHQSTITPSIGLSQPGLVFYEPCFAKELEWILLDALRSMYALGAGESTYLRLTTRLIDQSLFQLPEAEVERESLRNQVLEGAYRLVDRTAEPDYAPGTNVVHIAASGAMIPEAAMASELLLHEGVFANVINVTSADRLYRGYQSSTHAALQGREDPSPGPIGRVIRPADRKAPVVTVLDGHPQSLAWIGGALGTRVLPLGVTRFGESGTRDDLYAACGIDVPAIVEACLLAVEL